MNHEPIQSNEKSRALAKQQLRGVYWTLFGAFFIWFLVSLPSTILGDIIEQKTPTNIFETLPPITGTLAIWYIAMLVIETFILFGPFCLGFAGLSLKRIRGQEIAVKNVFDGFKRFKVSLLLDWAITFFMFMWCLLLIVPGIIKGLSYSMAYFIMHDDVNIRPLEALKKSKIMMKGYKWKLCDMLWNFIGKCLLIGLPIMIPLVFLEQSSVGASINALGIVSSSFVLLVLPASLIGLYLLPFLMLSLANFYENLKRSQEKISDDVPDNVSQETVENAADSAKKLSDFVPQALCLAVAIFLLPVMIGCTSTVQNAPTSDIRWYTRNPDATHFEISTAAELAGLAALVNGTAGLEPEPSKMPENPDDIARFNLSARDFAGKTITLRRNIDLSSYGSTFNNGNGWIAIGDCGAEMERNLGECDDPNVFAGTFDGNGKTISGLYSVGVYGGDFEEVYPIYTPGGLFGYVTGTVKNLGVVDARVIGGGGIVGMLVEGEVSNVYFTGTLEIADGGGGGAGGIVGRMYSGSISNCYFAGAVTVADSEYGQLWVGGIVGMADRGVVSNCYSAGMISGRRSGVGGVGGIVGWLDRGVVSNCYSTAEVGGKNSVGGIIGFAGNIDNVTIVSNASSRHSRNLDNMLKNRALFDITVSNNIALNSSVKLSGSREHTPIIVVVDEFGTEPQPVPYPSFSRAGRVVGGNDGGRLSNNAAFVGVRNISGETEWDDERNNLGINGADITIEEILSDGTLGGRFTSENGWTTENGKLPGLFGRSVELPEHLRR